LASIANTSRSGRKKRTPLLQLRAWPSRHWPEPWSNFTTRPTSGAVMAWTLVDGPGRPPGIWPPARPFGEVSVSPALHRVVPKPLQTLPSETTVVWLPENRTPAYTVLPLGLTASARGVSPNSVMIRSGVPPSVLPSAAGSNTQTSARPTPAVMSCGSPAPGTPAMLAWTRCCPRCAVVTNARCGLPANTMSRGSSPTSSVRTTRGFRGAVTSTTLMLSERWFTTHTSVLERTATDTGSMPTATLVRRARFPAPPTPNTSRRLFGVLTT
jgi:hypothetical protein